MIDPALIELLGSSVDESAEIEAIIRLDDAEALIPHVRMVSRFGSIATCRLRPADIKRVRQFPGVRSLKASRALRPGDESPRDNLSLPPSAPGSDRRRAPGLPLTGAGVVVGIVDWGCDFNHPDFRHADGSTRLLALWDQRDRASQAAPEPYGYGVVHTRSDIDRALQQIDAYEALDYHPAEADPDGSGSHGTHVMGIAAGNGYGGGPVGVAPEADIVFVHLANRGTGGLSNLGQSSRLLEAIAFIADIAGDRPWVINLSIGLHGGPHDGCTLAEKACDELLRSAPNRFIVQSAGNYLNKCVHSSGRLAQGEQRSLHMRVDPADVTPNELEVWYAGEDHFAIRTGSPSGAVSRWARLGERVPIIEHGEVVGTIYNRAADPNNGDNHIDLFLYPNASPGDWQATLHGLRTPVGDFHAWLERDGACRACQTRFVEADCDRRYTTGTLANGHVPIVVGAYDGHDADNPPAPFSSIGPTRDGRPKPDIVACGVGVLSARSARPGNFDDRGHYVRKSGTSMAAPHVTGAVALCLQGAPRPLHSHEIRRLVLSNVRQAKGYLRGSKRLGNGYLDTSKLVSATIALARVEQESSRTCVATTGATPTKEYNAMKSTYETEYSLETSPQWGLPSVLESSPINSIPPDVLYQQILSPDAFGGQQISDGITVLGRPGERPSRHPRVGDVLLRVAMGEPGLGQIGVVTGLEQWSTEHLNQLPANAEGQLPGIYAPVAQTSQSGRAPATWFARRVLDLAGRVPPGQVLLSLRSPGHSDDHADWQQTESFEYDDDFAQQSSALTELLDRQGAPEDEAPDRLIERDSGETLVQFPSGESLVVVHDDSNEYRDPTNSGNPLLDTSDNYRVRNLSSNFTVDELAQSGSRDFPKARIDVRLVECLQKLRDYINKPVVITSGYRSWGHNWRLYQQCLKRKKAGKKCTVAKKSQHLAGRAVDIKVSGMSGMALAKAAIDACGCNIALGVGNGYIHLDVRGRPAFWGYGKNGDDYERRIRRYHRQKCSARSEHFSDDSFDAEGLAFDNADEQILFPLPTAKSVAFPSITLPAVQGAQGPFQEYFDPLMTGNPLLDTGAKYRNKQLSKDFKVGEFAQAEKKRVRFHKARIDPKLVDCLQQMRDLSGKGISIVDGYYSYAYLLKLQKRKRLSTLPISPHLGGQGAKIRMKGLSGLDIARWAVTSCPADTRIGVGRRSATVFVKQKETGPTSWLPHGESRERAIKTIRQYQSLLFKQPPRIAKGMRLEQFNGQKHMDDVMKLFVRWAIEDQNVRDERTLSESMLHASHVYRHLIHIADESVAKERRKVLREILQEYVRPALRSRDLTSQQAGTAPSTAKGAFRLADARPELPGVAVEGRYELLYRNNSRFLGATLVVNQAGERIEAVYTQVTRPNHSSSAGQRKHYRHYGELQADGSFLMKLRGDPNDRMRLTAKGSRIEIRGKYLGKPYRETFRKVSNRPVLMEQALQSFRPNGRGLISDSEWRPLLRAQIDNLENFFGDGDKIRKYLKDFFDITRGSAFVAQDELQRRSIRKFAAAVKAVLDDPNGGIHRSDDRLANFYIRRLLSLQKWRRSSNSPSRSLLDWIEDIVAIARSIDVFSSLGHIRRFTTRKGKLHVNRYRMTLKFDAASVGAVVGIGAMKGYITIEKTDSRPWKKPYRFRLIGGALASVAGGSLKIGEKYESTWETTDPWRPDHIPGWFEMGIGSVSAKGSGFGGGASGGFIHILGDSPFKDPLQFVFADTGLGPKARSKFKVGADLSMYIGRVRDRDFDFSGYPSIKIPTDYASTYGLTRDAHFGFDSAMLSGEARRAIRIMCANELPALMQAGTELKIVGHTDRRGSKSYNLGLSAARAANVKQAIEDVLGAKLRIPRKSRCKIRGPGLCVEGRGEAAAAAANKPDGKRDADDRRVDVTLNSRLVLRLSAR